MLSARREAGNNLYDILLNQNLPAVVDIHEKVFTEMDEYGRYVDVFMIEIDTEIVHHEHVTMKHLDTIEFGFSETRNPIKKALRSVARFLARVTV